MQKLYRLTAFPKISTGGNKAGVRIDSDSLTETEMQSIAAEVGYSETAFVMKSTVADYKVRFFTPKNEVPLCGHATIATFNLLRDLGMINTGILTQETGAGILKLEVGLEFVFMQQRLPEFGDFVSIQEIKTAFTGYEPHPWHSPRVVSTGLREIFLPVKDRLTLDSLVPNVEVILDLSNRYNVIGIHAFCLDTEVDAYGRNFAPAVGIVEESATGTSNGALACYLYNHVIKKNKYILRQGYSMDLPSEIIAKIIANDTVIDEIWVGGTAKLI